MNSVAETRPLSPTATERRICETVAQIRSTDRHRFCRLAHLGIFLLAVPRTFGAYDIYNSLMSTTPFFALMAIPLTLGRHRQRN